jgi:hypothetical protein
VIFSTRRNRPAPSLRAVRRSRAIAPNIAISRGGPGSHKGRPPAPKRPGVPLGCRAAPRAAPSPGAVDPITTALAKRSRMRDRLLGLRRTQVEHLGHGLARDVVGIGPSPPVNTIKSVHAGTRAPAHECRRRRRQRS